jgi:hypothetical protein
MYPPPPPKKKNNFISLTFHIQIMNKVWVQLTSGGVPTECISHDATCRPYSMAT